MGLLRTILIILFALTAISLMFLYLLPFNIVDFTASGNYNFSVNNGTNQMQFYPNMRFASPDISYRISDCPLQKQNDMESAFDIIQNLTSLRFYPIDFNEKISVTCDDKIVSDNNGMFIAGEGGPKNITVAGNFYVIDSGEILLIKPSNCPKPNIAIHELMHVLGFEHSSNPDNIMYSITKCDQTLGDDMIQLINDLYSIPSYPDLAFENVSSIMKGRFLDVNMTIRNIGLNDSGKAKVDIFADNNLIKEIDLDPLEIGNGRFIYLGNIWVSQISISELELVISSDFNEISKTNNEIKLK
jgi:hypothetical protein